jgi:hypothetical protein
MGRAEAGAAMGAAIAEDNTLNGRTQLLGKLER